jgi:hypothetical protein
MTADQALEAINAASTDSARKELEHGTAAAAAERALLAIEYLASRNNEGAAGYQIHAGGHGYNRAIYRALISGLTGIRHFHAQSAKRIRAAREGEAMLEELARREAAEAQRAARREQIASARKAREADADFARLDLAKA